MMSFTPTTYSSTASNAPSSAAGSPSPSRMIFNGCGFGVVASGDRARGATAGLVGDSGPPVEPSCITSSSSSAPGGLSSSRGASRVLAAGIREVHVQPPIHPQRTHPPALSRTHLLQRDFHHRRHRPRHGARGQVGGRGLHLRYAAVSSRLAGMAAAHPARFRRRRLLRTPLPQPGTRLRRSRSRPKGFLRRRVLLIIGPELLKTRTPSPAPPPPRPPPPSSPPPPLRARTSFATPRSASSCCSCSPLQRMRQQAPTHLRSASAVRHA